MIDWSSEAVVKNSAVVQVKVVHLSKVLGSFVFMLLLTNDTLRSFGFAVFILCIWHS